MTGVEGRKTSTENISPTSEGQSEEKESQAELRDVIVGITKIYTFMDAINQKLDFLTKKIVDLENRFEGGNKNGNEGSSTKKPQSPSVSPVVSKKEMLILNFRHNLDKFLNFETNLEQVLNKRTDKGGWFTLSLPSRFVVKQATMSDIREQKPKLVLLSVFVGGARFEEANVKPVADQIRAIVGEKIPVVLTIFRFGAGARTIDVNEEFSGTQKQKWSLQYCYEGSVPSEQLFTSGLTNEESFGKICTYFKNL